jgi:FtsH-binding integral membrane protein
MSYAYEMDRPLAAVAAESERAAFIRRTYTHLAFAVLAFVGLEAAVFNLIPRASLEQFMQTFFMGGAINMLILLAVFIGVGALARWWAYNGTSQAMAYAGLALYVLFEVVIFIPLLYMATYGINRLNGPGSSEHLLGQAAVITLSVFGGLTAAVFVTKKDFSFLGSILWIAGFGMIGLCFAGMFFGWSMGLWFSFLGVALASGYILYDTSNVIHRFRTDQHVAAALELFASLAYLFYHVVRILLILSSGRER